MRDKKSNSVFKLKKAALVAAILSGTLNAYNAYAVGESSIRGVVSGAATAGAQVIATDINSGRTIKAIVNADGSYSLLGLTAGSYKIVVKGNGFEQQSDVVTVAVGDSNNLNIIVAQKTTATGTAGEGVIAIKGSGRKAVRNSEVSTSVSTKQIDAMPQNSRNFLAFAAVAPGVRFSEDQSSGYTKLQSGAESANAINVFIDGVSQKNNVLNGGVSGQDSSRGNPFPQSAIQEYKVITSNYKAEYDQLSSAAIVAVTKSGTNEFHGEVFGDLTNNHMSAYTPQQKTQKENGFDRAKYRQNQWGASVGGPIVKDKAHFFIAYEGKDITTPRALNITNLTGLSDAAVAEIKSLGAVGSKSFKEHLFSGKVDWQLNDRQRLELTAKYRKEDDFVPENDGLSTSENVKTRQQEEKRVELKHELTGNNWLNEARLGYEDSSWNPHSLSTNPFVKWKTSTGQDIFFSGGSPDAQNKGQSGILLQNDFTYTGLSKNKIKVGLKFKDLEYDLQGTQHAVDSYENWWNGTAWEQRNFTPKSDGTTLNYKNKQFGIYAQDDIQVTNKLELNAGLRWDYETNALNSDSVTNPNIVTALNKVDSSRNGIAPLSAGQTYAQSLALAGIDVNDFINTGNNRKPFTKAIAPRLGFSYDVKGDKDTVVFGGFGRSYDRTIADKAIDEITHNGTNGDVFLIKNQTKAPYSDQFSLGLRQRVGQWNAEVGASYINSKNGFIWYSGNRLPDGSAGTKLIDPAWGNIPGYYGNLVLGDFLINTRTTRAYLKADKPFTKASGWGASLTYTYSKGQNNTALWNTTDSFSWVSGTGKVAAGYHPSTEVERHRFVGTGTVALPYGVNLSGTVTLGSGKPYRITDCTNGWDACYYRAGKGSTFSQFDLSLAKEFKLGYGQTIELRADVLNVFNKSNYSGRNDFIGYNPSAADKANLGKVNGTIEGPMRTVKVSLRYKF